MSKITIKNIQEIKSFENIREDWDCLLASSPVKSAFLTWEWLYGWWKVNGADRDLWLITAWRDNKLIGIAPLMRETRKKLGVPLRAIVNMGTPQNDVGGFLFNDEGSEVPLLLWNYLAENKSKWDIIELIEFTFSGTEHKVLRAQSRDKKLLWREEKNIHYFIALEDTWDKFSERLARKFRYNLRRALRLAEEIGPVEIRHFTGNKVTQDVFQTVLEINRHAHYPRLYHSQQEQALIKELTEQTAPRQGWLDVHILSVNNEPIAYEYGFGYEGRFEDWRSGYDTRFPVNISIGKLLAMQVVQKCIQEKYNEIDFLRGDETYKQEWMPSQREFVNIRIFNNKSPQAVLAYLWLEKIKPLLKKPVVEQPTSEESKDESRQD
jgi:CelD/BcsL family acetyltransferase involved in cellulose biosynthesis